MSLPTIATSVRPMMVRGVARLRPGPNFKSFRAGLGFDRIPPLPDILWWKMNENGGTSLIDDSTKKTNTGTIANAAMYISGKSGTALQGSSASSYWGKRAALDYGLVGKITVAFWINPASYASGIQAVMESATIRYYDEQSAWVVFTDTDTNLWVGMHDGSVSGSSLNMYGNFPGPTPGAWAHVLLVLDNINGTISGIINGVSQTYTPVGNTRTIAGWFNTLDLSLLSRTQNTLFGNHAIDDLRIWSGDKSAYALQIMADLPPVGSTGILAESLAFADSPSVIAIFTPAIAESIALADSPSSTATSPQSVAESIALTDNFTATVLAAVTVAESVNFADSQDATGGAGVNQVESFTLADSFTATVSYAVAVAESITLSEARSAGAVYPVIQAENMALADNPTATASYAVNLAENLALGDAPNAATAFVVALAESLALVDIPVAGVLWASVTVAETLALLDSCTFTVPFTGSFVSGSFVQQNDLSISVNQTNRLSGNFVRTNQPTGTIQRK